MSTQTQGYIMLSYQWDHQKVVLRIRDRLRKEGYKVWMDVDDMHGSIDTAMANAVKDAALVLACLSKKYEESENCQSEASCIKQFKRPFIPLMMEKYELNDWVAGIFSRRLYVEFPNEATFDESFQELLRNLKKYPNLKPQVQNPDQLDSSLPPAPPTGATSSSPPTANPDVPHTSSDRPTSNTEEPERMPELSEMDFSQLLKEVSSWWKKHGKINMLKVLLSEFEEIQEEEIDEQNDPAELFKLLVGNGYISATDPVILIEAAVLGGLRGVEPKIKKKIPTFPGFNEFVIQRFSNHRQNVMKFGKAMSKSNKDSIRHLWNLDADQKTDQWGVIFELERKEILTSETEKKQAFIERLEKNDMKREADALKTFLSESQN